MLHNKSRRALASASPSLRCRIVQIIKLSKRFAVCSKGRISGEGLLLILFYSTIYERPINYIRTHVLRAVCSKITVLWDVTTCSLVVVFYAVRMDKAGFL
jgi:hypothetical protein